MMNLFPPRLHFLIFSIRSFLTGEYRRATYAQAGEDIIVGFIFRDNKPRFYVDVGAHHPLRGSNTHLLYKHGWNGINIEPNPGLQILFKIFRKRDINVCAGVAGKNGEEDFYMFSEPGVNTFSKEEAERRIAKGNIPFLKKIKIPVYTLKTIFEKYSVKHIDLLNVDAEGMDLEVLESNDWSRYVPTVVIVEDNNFNASEPSKSAVYNYLAQKGYKLFAYTGVTLIFKKI
jgi:FkbM family methyltransferase